MDEPRTASAAAGRQFAGDIELLRVSEAIFAASSVADLARRFNAVVPRLFDVPMYGFYAVEPWTREPELVTAVNVSDFFVARYERAGREVDPLHKFAVESRQAAYNIGMMSMEEWLEHPVYTRACYIADLRHTIDAPLVFRDGIVGNLNLATNDPTRGFTPHQVRLAEALGRVIGTTLARIRYIESIERERDQAQIAAEVVGAAVVLSDPVHGPRPNEVARRLLAQVVDGEMQLHRMTARPTTTGGFSHHLEVELVAGGAAFLHSHSRPTHPDGGGLITVLELQRGDREISEHTLVALTPREREVALRVVDGRSDREIAEDLSLSPHTVHQYVKRIYRKLDVDSRVALTRLLLRSRESGEDL